MSCPPDPFPDNPYFTYLNNKFNFLENIGIAVGFIVILLLGGLLFLQYAKC